MSAKIFAETNLGKRVKCSADILKDFGSWVDWEGKIIGSEHNQVIVETLAEEHPNSKIGTTTYWCESSLELINESILQFRLKENQHPCSKCKSSSCVGFERIECLLGSV